eukprot:7377146-Prymnesium_polylepis.1
MQTGVHPRRPAVPAPTQDLAVYRGIPWYWNQGTGSNIWLHKLPPSLSRTRAYTKEALWGSSKAAMHNSSRA